MDADFATGADNVPSTGDVITYDVAISNNGTTCLRGIALSHAFDAPPLCQPSYTGNGVILWISCEIERKVFGSRSRLRLFSGVTSTFRSYATIYAMYFRKVDEATASLLSSASETYCPQDVQMECWGTYTVEQTDMDRSFVEKTISFSASSLGEEHVGGSADNIVALPGKATVTIGEPISPGLYGHVSLCLVAVL